MRIQAAPLRLVSSAPDAPHPTAQRVMEMLEASTRPGADLAGIRRNYNLSRRHEGKRGREAFRPV